MSEPPELDMGAALARTVAALERVRLDALQPKDREPVQTALREATAALEEYRRTMRSGEPFAQED